MSWEAKLSRPLATKRGLLKTLSDARDVMLTLPELHQQAGYWQAAARLILAAAEKPSRKNLSAATDQLQIAIDKEGPRLAVKG